MTTPEFSRPRRLDTLGAGDVTVELAAEPEERAALAERFGLIGLDRLEARMTLHREAAGIVARGHVSADASQACVATGEPVPARVEEDFAIRFVPQPRDAPEEEIELSEDECDTIFYSGGAIDLGEAAAETMALALDPFPRCANADKILRDAGVLSEEEAGPFGKLAALKDKLAGK